jgi:transcriptional regulator with GAF, ATPase, and Fis domain
MMEYDFVGNHPSIQKIRELINMVSDTAFNVLLLGETGSGKEVVARLLHCASSRSKKRFIKVNCAALPLTLLESELFGYEKGAFTGAEKPKPGKFELASDGVIFLDEIGDMPLLLQAKLLQVLQSGEFARLGGTRDVKVNAWVIASTNHDLESDMKRGLFREDLYYRLNIIKIELPPLRERKEDISLLTRHFLQKYRSFLAIDEGIALNSGIQRLFEAYHWPGNVRELAAIILRLMVGDEAERVKSELMHNMAADGVSVPADLLLGLPEERSLSALTNETTPKSDVLRSLKELKAESTHYIEREAILHALKMSGWNKKRAARMLKISYKALFYKMANYGIRDAIA